MSQTSQTAEAVAARIVEILPVAMRDPNPANRAAANAELFDLYACMAGMQKRGVTVPTIDFGAI